MRPLLHFQQTGISSSKLLTGGLSVVTSQSIATPGGGYAKNDVVTVSGGTFLQSTTYRVDEVNRTGGVVRLTRLTSGVATTKPANAAATTVSPSGGTGLTLTLTWTDNAAPDGAKMVKFQADTQAVRWRDDGTAPTASVGMLLAIGATEVYTYGSGSAIRVIEATATAKVNVTFYG